MHTIHNLHPTLLLYYCTVPNEKKNASPHCCCRSENVGAAAEDAADSVASAVKDGVESTAKAAMDGAKDVMLAAKDRVSLGGVEVSPLGVGAWAWGDTMFWGYSEAMDKELQEVNYSTDESQHFE